MNHKGKTPILCDVDGVVIDFIAGCLNELNPKLGTNVKYEDCHNDIRDLFVDFGKQNFDKMVQTEGFCYNLPAIPEAVGAIKKLMRQYNVVFLTKPYDGSKTWHYERYLKLKELFDISREQIIFAADKRFVHGMTLIEDNFKNSIEWSAYMRKPAILISQPWNEKEINNCKCYHLFGDSQHFSIKNDDGTESSFEMFNDWKHILKSFGINE